MNKRIGKRTIEPELISELIKNNKVIELKDIIKNFNIEAEYFSKNFSKDFLKYCIEEYDVSVDLVEFIINYFKYSNLNYGYEFSKLKKLNEFSNDNFFKPPLAVAIEKNNFKVANLLIEYGADINYIKPLVLKKILNKKNSRFILDKGIKLTSNLIDILIYTVPVTKNKHIIDINTTDNVHNANYFLKQIFNYYIYDNNFILNLLGIYKNKKPFSRKNLEKVITTEKAKLSINRHIYKIAIDNENFNILTLLYDNDSRENEIILNDIYAILNNRNDGNEILGKIENKDLRNSISILLLYHDTILSLIKSSDIIQLQNFVKENSIQLDKFNNRYTNNKDLLKFAIENTFSIEIIKYIIKECQYNDLNIYDNKEQINMGRTYLYFAVSQNKFKISDFLLKNGADINCGDILNWLYNEKLLNIKNLKYCLNHSVDIHSNLNFLIKLIDNNKNEFINIILKYTSFDHLFILNLLSIYKNKTVLTNQQLESIISKKQYEKNKIDFNSYLYCTALDNDNFDLIIHLLEIDPRDKSIILNEFFNLLENNSSDNKKEKQKILINHIKDSNLEIPMNDKFLNNLGRREEQLKIIIEKIKFGYIKELNEYIFENEIQLSYFTTNDFDLLIYSIKNDISFEMIKFIIYQYKNLNYYINMYETPLLWAFSKTDFALIDLLIENGADINYYVKDKYTILQLIIYEKYFTKENFIYILDHGLKITSELMNSLIIDDMKGIIRVILERNPKIPIENEWYINAAKNNGEILELFFGYYDHGKSLFLNNNLIIYKIFDEAVRYNNSDALKVLLDHEFFDFKKFSLETTLKDKKDEWILSFANLINSIIGHHTFDFKIINFEMILNEIVDNFLESIEFYYYKNYEELLEDQVHNDKSKKESRLEVGKTKYKKYFYSIEIIINSLMTHETFNFSVVNFEKALLSIIEFPIKIMRVFDLEYKCSNFIKLFIKKSIDHESFDFSKYRFDTLLYIISQSVYIKDDFDFINFIIRKSFYNKTMSYSLMNIGKILFILRRIYNINVYKSYIRELFNYRQFNLSNYNIKDILLETVKIENNSITEFIFEGLLNHRSCNFNKNLDIKKVLLVTSQVENEAIFKYLVKKFINHRTLKFNDINDTVEGVLLASSKIKNVSKCKFIVEETFKNNKYNPRYLNIASINFKKILLSANRCSNIFIMKYIIDNLLGHDDLDSKVYEKILLSSSSIENIDSMKLIIKKLLNITSLEKINSIDLSNRNINNSQYIALMLNVFIKIGYIQFIKYFIENTPANLSLTIKDKNEESPIMVASNLPKYYGRGQDIFEYLLEFINKKGGIKDILGSTLLLQTALQDGAYILLQKIFNYYKTVDLDHLIQTHISSLVVVNGNNNDNVDDNDDKNDGGDEKRIKLIKSLVLNENHSHSKNNDDVDKFSILYCKPLFMLYLLNHKELLKKVINLSNVNKLDSNGFSILQYAIIKEDIEAVYYLVSLGADVNYNRNNMLHGHSAIDISLYIKNKEIISILLNHGKIMTKVFNEKGETPVYTLIKMQNYSDEEKIDILNCYIQKGYDINRCNKKGESVFDYILDNEITSYSLFKCFLQTWLDGDIDKSVVKRIIDKNRMDLLKILIPDYVDVNTKNIDGKGNTLLIYSIRAENIPLVNYLIDQQANVNKKDEKGNTPLIVATELQNESVIKYLIKHGADVNKKNKKGEVPLIIASEFNNENLIKYYIDSGSDVNREDDQGNLALRIAIKANNLEMVKFLIQSGADIHKENNFSELFLSLKDLNCDNNTKMLNYLVNYGLDINKEDQKGDTPLIYAIKTGNEFLTQYFINHGANINQKDRNGETPLIVAIEYNFVNNINLIKYLVTGGADVNEEDKNGNTPLIVATKRNNKYIMKYLINCGADINKENKRGKTPLKIAIKNENLNLIKYLIGNGADVNKKSLLNGSTPLSKAIKYQSKNVGIIEYLIGSGAVMTNNNNTTNNSNNDNKDNNTNNNNSNDNNNDKNSTYNRNNDGNNNDDSYNNNNNNINNNNINFNINNDNNNNKNNNNNNNSNNNSNVSEDKDETTFLNLLDKVKYLVENGVDINKSNTSGDTPLSVAVDYNNKIVIKYLVDHGADINMITKSGETFLIRTIKNGYMDMFKYLITCGADVNKEDNNGDTPLIISAEFKNKYLVKYLIECGADINKENELGNTPLNAVIKVNNFEMVKYLIEFGANVNKECKNGNTPLKVAIEANNLNIIKYLIGNGADVNQKSHSKQDDTTPFIKATKQEFENMSIIKYLIGSGANINENSSNDILAMNGNASVTHNVLDKVKYLIDHGVDINKVNESGDTSLSVAVDYNNKILVKYLIDHGADINKENKLGETFLINTVKNNYLDMAKHLIQNGADVNKEDKNGDTPLIIAAKMGNKKLVKYLMGCGANINQENKHGTTPLNAVIEMNHLDMVKYLVGNGADINMESQHGYSHAPLKAAIHICNLTMIKYLIEHGASINQEDQNSETPIFTAVKVNNLNILKYLIGNGADVNKKNNHGDTPLSLAIQHIPKNLNIIEYLIGSGADLIPLNISMKDNVIDKLKHLIDNGANVNKENCLSMAVNYNNKNMIKYLVNYGVDINMENSVGETYLINTLRNDYLDTAKYLIQCGADVNKEDRFGNLPLIIAIEHNNEKLVKYLIECGADINKKTSKGDTPLNYTFKKRNIDMIDCLIDCNN